MRPLIRITADLKKVNYRVINLNAQLANHATISQTRLIKQRLETLTTIQDALKLEYKTVCERNKQPAQSIH